MSENVFSNLFRYGPGEEENYLTEAFVFLLKLLLERTPDRGLPIINQLSGLPQEAHLRNPESVAISTQVIVAEGRPDIEIRDGQDTLVYVEVKHDASLGVRQLERYWAELQAGTASNTRLVFLTRSRVSARETTLAPEKYHHVCWYEIHNQLAKTEIQDEVCQYFVHSFLRFLEEKRMSMEKVPQEYIQGVPALLKLTDMIEASIPEAIPNAKHKSSSGWSWRGFNINGYYYGIRFAQPSLVVFENNLGNSPTFKRDLALESVHFFSLRKDEQFECLVEFLREASRDAVPKLVDS